MANFYATARSNYFEVKDLEAFKNACDDNGLEYGCRIPIVKQGGIMITPDNSSDYGGWPCGEDEEGNIFDIVEFIQEHIAEGSCCVLIEVGNEKLRYLSGWTAAITHDDVKVINLEDIYPIASGMVEDGDVSHASY